MMSLPAVVVIYLFIALLCVVNSFNFDVDFPIVYSDPFTFNGPTLQKSSYFGFSVILFEGANGIQPWLQVGAPRGANPFLTDFTTGVVFRCGIKQKCSIVRLKTERERGISRYAFIGNSMDISEDKTRYAVCGHKWIEADRRDYWMQGACIWSNIMKNNTDLLTPFYGLPYNNSQVDEVNGRPAYNYAQGQAGFSAQFSKYEKDTELLLGAPGSYNWHGAPLIYRTEIDKGPIASRIYSPWGRYKRSINDIEFGSLNIASGKKTTETLIFDLLGYSVTSGYFFSKYSISYVASAPKAQMLGKVLVFNFDENSMEALRVQQTRQGTQIGEYFGASLSAGDVNNDGFDDLFVGAPLHKRSKYDEGRVYIFLGSQSNLIQPEKGSIDGKVPGGRFGQNIMYLGDIDYDGYGDVAVAAPYEDEGAGIVYIFRGAANGLITEPAQKIVGRSLEPNIKSFGTSMSKTADIDGNKYKDIAIGAYLSGHSVLLRGKVLVTIQQAISTPVDKINYDSTTFVFDSCVRFTGQSVQGPIHIKRSVKLDDTHHRATLKPGFASDDSISLTKIGDYICKTFEANIKQNISNRYDPITIEVSLELVVAQRDPSKIQVGKEINGIDNFCTFCPMVNKFTSEMKKIMPVAFSLGCRNNDVCYAFLLLTSSLLNLDNTNNYYTIGSRKYLTLQTDIENKGENAHLTELFITLPVAVRLRSIPSKCSEQNATYIKCDVANTLKPNQKERIELELDMQEVNSGKYDGVLDIQVTVKTSSENNNTNFQQQISLSLKREADLALTGKSKEQSYSYGNITHGKADFMQVYQIEKFGVSPIDQVVLHIWIPTVVTTNSKGDVNFVYVYPPVGSLSGQPLTCQSNISYVVDSNNKGISTDSIDTDEGDGNNSNELLRRRRSAEKYQQAVEVSDLDYPLNRTLYLNCSSSDVSCEKIICTAGPFKSTHDVAELQLKMKIDVSDLADYLGGRDIIIVATNGAIAITNSVQNHGEKRPHEASVPSVFIGPSAEYSIPIWIIILAVICGLLLLLLIIAGLYKAGFFNRANKKKLEEERMVQNEEETGMTSEPHTEEDKVE